MAVDRSALKHLRAPLASLDKIVLHSVSTRHPHSTPTILIHNLLGEKIPYGTFPADRGILVLEQQVPLIVYQIVAKRQPFIRKRLSIGGSAVKKQVVVDVPIGTGLNEAIGLILWKGQNSA